MLRKGMLDDQMDEMLEESKTPPSPERKPPTSMPPAPPVKKTLPTISPPIAIDFAKTALHIDEKDYLICHQAQTQFSLADFALDKAQDDINQLPKSSFAKNSLQQTERLIEEALMLKTVIASQLELTSDTFIQQTYQDSEKLKAFKIACFEKLDQSVKTKIEKLQAEGKQVQDAKKAYENYRNSPLFALTRTSEKILNEAKKVKDLKKQHYDHVKKLQEELSAIVDFQQDENKLQPISKLNPAHHAKYSVQNISDLFAKFIEAKESFAKEKALEEKISQTLDAFKKIHVVYTLLDQLSAKIQQIATFIKNANNLITMNDEIQMILKTVVNKAMDISDENKRIAQEKIVEEKRFAEEKVAEEKRLAEEKMAEEKRREEEKAAEEKRLAEEKAAKARLIEQKRIALEKHTCSLIISLMTQLNYPLKTENPSLEDIRHHLKTIKQNLTESKAILIDDLSSCKTPFEKIDAALAMQFREILLDAATANEIHSHLSKVMNLLSSDNRREELFNRTLALLENIFLVSADEIPPKEDRSMTSLLILLKLIQYRLHDKEACQKNYIKLTTWIHSFKQKPKLTYETLSDIQNDPLQTQAALLYLALENLDLNTPSSIKTVYHKLVTLAPQEIKPVPPPVEQKESTCLVESPKITFPKTAYSEKEIISIQIELIKKIKQAAKQRTYDGRSLFSSAEEKDILEKTKWSLQDIITTLKNIKTRTASQLEGILLVQLGVNSKKVTLKDLSRLNAGDFFMAAFHFALKNVDMKLLVSDTTYQKNIIIKANITLDNIIKDRVASSSQNGLFSGEPAASEKKEAPAARAGM